MNFLCRSSTYFILLSLLTLGLQSAHCCHNLRIFDELNTQRHPTVSPVVIKSSCTDCSFTVHEVRPDPNVMFKISKKDKTIHVHSQALLKTDSPDDFNTNKVTVTKYSMACLAKLAELLSHVKPVSIQCNFSGFNEAERNTVIKSPGLSVLKIESEEHYLSLILLPTTIKKIDLVEAYYLINYQFLTQIHSLVELKVRLEAVLPELPHEITVIKSFSPPPMPIGMHV